MTSTDLPRLSVRSCADLIAAVPYLLGFHPADSVVVVAMHGTRITFAARADLPDRDGSADPSGSARPNTESADPGGSDERAAAARHLAAVVARQTTDRATVLGYGPASRVTCAVDAVRQALTEAGILVLDALRVTDGRYWSYLCQAPACCPPDGTPYDSGTSQVAAAAVLAGQVALPDRAALVAQVAPAGGTEQVRLQRAAERARRRFAGLVTPRTGGDVPRGRAVRAAGNTAIRAALRRYRRGERLDDDEVAWLSLLLTDPTVRDLAWERTDGRDADKALWADVLRRAQPDLIAAPGCLLAFATWRAGHGALAVVAVQRVLAQQPDYPLALLLDDLLRRGVPPTRLAGWPAVQLPGAVRPRRRRGRGAR
uniref:DUF4192 domain-containing protein n=1 Tax=Salinispora arenicola (strain CNS-205) TaxID=391037 RepID=A8LXD9_SALAI